LSPSTQVSKGDLDDNELVMSTMVNLESSGLWRSSRIASGAKKNYNFFSGISKFCALGVLLLSTLAQPSVAFSHVQEPVNAAIYHCNVINANFDGSLNKIHHIVLAAGKSNNKHYTFREMLKEDDASDFIKAMEKEPNDHSSHGHWEIVKRFEIPPGVNTIQAIWSFKCKHFPDGTLNKHKARLCAHGGMQQWGVNY